MTAPIPIEPQVDPWPEKPYCTCGHLISVHYGGSAITASPCSWSFEGEISCTCVEFTPDDTVDVMNDVCAFHHRVEKDEEGVYRVCGECGHLWQSQEAFRDDVSMLFDWLNNVPEDWGKPSTALEVPDDLNEIYACPLCSHDF